MDLFGESVADARTADRAAADYLSLATELAWQPEDVWLSVDLSHLGLDVVPQECAAHLAAIAAALPEGRRVQVGAEDHDRTDAILECILAVAADGFADRLGLPSRRICTGPATTWIGWGAGLHIRLVKGAYVEPASRALPYGEPTDVAYLLLAHRLAEADAEFALATHDGVLREALLARSRNLVC